MNPVLEARQHTIDSTREAQKRHLDELKASRQRSADSIKTIREERGDSLAAVRKYRDSKHYKDSVTHAREARLGAIKTTREKYFDSVKTARKKVMDNTIAARKTFTDQLKARQKKRTDSLATIRKYRESKRFQDSVVVVRKQKLDSLKTVRKNFNDSIASARRVHNDSLAAVRKVTMDSTIAARTKLLDSMKAKRQVRADSLAKIKEKKEKAQKDRLKNREDKMKLAIELKIKKKREAWSNEKMLKKRWSPPRKAIQNTFTRYNYYYNTDRKMDEALLNMQRVKKDNYDSTLALFPFDPDRDSASLAPDMDSIIQKASIGIQIHDPRTKWGDDLYLLMGEAYYYKGDYENASTAFKYIVSMYDRANKKSSGSRGNSASKTKDAKGKPATSVMQADDKKFLDFLKHRSVHNESLLWLARTFTEWHKEGEAESVLDLLATDPNLPDNLKGRLALEKAYVSLSQHDNKNAAEQLTIVAADNNLPDWVRQRASFINGQLLYDRGDYAGSAASYQQVIDLRPKIEMDFYARKNMAYSLMMGGGNQEDAVASMRKILKDGKYVPYYEQVYYVIGRLSANTGKNDEAITYLKKSISAPRATKKQKALSFAALGGVYYELHKYNSAKLFYDSAALLANNAPNDSTVNLAVRRATVLDFVTRPANIIYTQDSLLALASSSDREQRSEVRKYIRYLRDLKRDSIFAAENAGVNSVIQNSSNTAAAGPQGGGTTNYANWYFSNPVQMQQGLNEFKRKWGNRPLVDKWRRLASISIGSGNNTATAGDNNAPDDGQVAELDEEGLPTEESLMAFIPNGPERKEDALKSIRRAHIDLADAYIKRLEDYPEAIDVLDTLDKRFPAHEYKDEELYLRYLVALRQSNTPQMKTYAAQLLQQFPESKWAQLVKPTEDGANLPDNGVPVAEFYNITYELLLQRQYDNSLQRARDGQNRYKDEHYKKKFRIAEAIALLGVNEYGKADTIANDFIKKNPVDSLRPWADMVISYIKKYRIEHPGAIDAAAASSAAHPAGAVPLPPGPDANAPKTAADIAASAAGSSNEPSAPLVDPAAPTTPPITPPKEYMYNAKETHYVVFGFPGMEQRAMGVKAAMGDFNTFKFPSLGLGVHSEMMTTEQGLIVVRSFESAAKAKIYLNELKATTQVFREYKSGEYQLFLISATNYAKLMADKGMAEYFEFYRNNYK